MQRWTQYEVSRIELPRGSRISMFTGGIHEASDGQMRLFGREWLARLLAETSGLSPGEQLDAVVHDARVFEGRDGLDDVTLLCADRM